MAEKARDEIDELFRDGRAIDEALRKAVRKALLRHKQMGLPVVSWQDGQVVWIPPEEIVVDEPGEPKKPGPLEGPGLPTPVE